MISEITLGDRSPDNVDRQAGRNLRERPVVTVTGLPGSGSEAMGEEVARITGRRFVGDEIPEKLSRRLRCSRGELEALERSFRSVWSRILRAWSVPCELYPAMEIGFDGSGDWINVNRDAPYEYLTEHRYLQGLKGVVTELALAGDVVIHGHGSHVLIPNHIPAMHVLVGASQQTTDGDRPPRSKTPRRQHSREARQMIAMYKRLFGVELLDVGLYDLVLDLRRMSNETASRMVAEALGESSSATQVTVPTLVLEQTR